MKNIVCMHDLLFPGRTINVVEGRSELSVIKCAINVMIDLQKLLGIQFKKGRTKNITALCADCLSPAYRNGIP